MDCMPVKKIKILFVVDSLGIGGAERQLVELVRGLSSLGGYEIHLVCLSKTKKNYVENLEHYGVDIQYFLRKGRYDIFGPLSCLVRHIQKYNICLVHSFMNMGSLFGVMAAKITGTPIVCSAIRNARDKSLKGKYLTIMLARISDIFVANSQAGFRSRFKSMQSHFRVVYNGVDFSRFSECPGDMTRMRSNLGISGYAKVVGMVASLSPSKDQETLLEAAIRVLEVFPDTGFLFVGDGVKKKFLEQQINDLHLQKHVVMAGFREDVDKIYPLMDVCVLLSNAKIHLEGISNALVEAMACRVPVVASAGGGTNELLDNGKYGALVPYKDSHATAEAIIEVLSRPRVVTSRFVMEANMSVIERFGIERYVEEYALLYDQAMGGMV